MVARRRPPLVTIDQAKRLGFSVSQITRALRAAGEDRRPLSDPSVRRLSDPNASAPLWLRRLRDDRDMHAARAAAEHARKTAPKVRLFEVDLGVVDDKIFDGGEFTRNERIAFERIVEIAIDKHLDGELLSPVESAALARARREKNGLVWEAA